MAHDWVGLIGLTVSVGLVVWIGVRAYDRWREIHRQWEQQQRRPRPMVRKP